MKTQAFFGKNILAILVGACLFPSFADDTSEIKATVNGSGSIEAGQVVQGENSNSETDPIGKSVSHIWYQRVYMRLGVKAEIDPRTSITVMAENKVTYSWRQQQEFYDDLRPLYTIYPYHVAIKYIPFGEIEKPLLQVEAGVFPVKYNPDIKNLGEYLYRTGTYPPYIINDFDYAETPLTGMQVSSVILDSLNLHFMFTSESQQLPFNDWGISLLSDYTVAKAFTIGAGVYFSHLLPVNENYTTPQTSNTYATDTVRTATDTIITPHYYTFRGTKLMGRFSFDPKAFFSHSIFGENDLRIYAEAAVIGLNNYPKFYSELWRRCPVMVGLNIPAFKVLDVVSLELELFKYNFPNDYYNIFYKLNLPQPNSSSGNYDWNSNSLKWSLYANKRIARCFTLTGQIAFDHMRLLRHDQKNQDLEESLHKHGDWAWMLKSAFDF